MSKRFSYNVYTDENNGAGFNGASPELLAAARKAGLSTRGGFIIGRDGKYIPDEEGVKRAILGETFGGYGEDIDDRNYADIKARLQAGDYNEEQGKKLKGVFDSFTDDKRGTFVSSSAEQLATNYYEGLRSREVRARESANQQSQASSSQSSADETDRKINEAYTNNFGPGGERLRRALDEPEGKERRSFDDYFGNSYAATQGRPLMGGGGYAQSIGKNLGTEAFRLASNYQKSRQGQDSRFSV